MNPRSWAETSVVAGSALVITAAFLFACSAVTARLAFDAGASPSAAILTRLPMAAALAWGLMRGRVWRLIANRAVLGVGLIAGLLNAGLNAAYLTALSLLPVGVAVVIFFTNPIISSLLSRAVERTPIGPLRLAAMAAAFCGVVLTGGGGGGPISILGTALAAAAALLVAGLVVTGAVWSRRLGAVEFLFVSTGAATVLFAAYALAFDPPVAPGTAAGWLPLVAQGVLSAGALICFFEGVRRIAIARAALLANAEPLFAITIAAVVLGEVLAPAQWLGAGVLVAALCLPILAGRWLSPRRNM